MSRVPPISDLSVLLHNMEPVLNPGWYVFATLEPNQHIDIEQVIAVVREPEGMSVVLDEGLAKALGTNASARFAWITLNVNSDLESVGLTAAIASTLCAVGISCNVVAGANHDHIFVPDHQADSAIAELRSLQARSRLPAGDDDA